MIELPKNYGRNCFIAMMASWVMLFFVILGTLLYTGDAKITEAVGHIGTFLILVVFTALAIPCMINYHSRK